MSPEKVPHGELPIKPESMMWEGALRAILEPFYEPQERQDMTPQQMLKKLTLVQMYQLRNTHFALKGENRNATGFIYTLGSDGSAGMKIRQWLTDEIALLKEAASRAGELARTSGDPDEARLYLEDSAARLGPQIPGNEDDDFIF